MKIVWWNLKHGAQLKIVDRLSADISAALKQPDVQTKLTEMGMVIVGGPPSELAVLMHKEIPRWAELIKKSKATAN